MLLWLVLRNIPKRLRTVPSLTVRIMIRLGHLETIGAHWVGFDCVIVESLRLVVLVRVDKRVSHWLVSLVDTTWLAHLFRTQLRLIRAERVIVIRGRGRLKRPTLIVWRQIRTVRLVQSIHVFRTIFFRVFTFFRKFCNFFKLFSGLFPLKYDF
jgi:hypothetical protein